MSGAPPPVPGGVRLPFTPPAPSTPPSYNTTDDESIYEAEVFGGFQCPTSPREQPLTPSTSESAQLPIDDQGWYWTGISR